jgi:hypothetical protein
MNRDTHLLRRLRLRRYSASNSSGAAFFYHGNIEPSERVAVVLSAVRRSDGRLGHWCRVERETDAAPLADVFAVRRDAVRCDRRAAGSGLSPSPSPRMQ